MQNLEPNIVGNLIPVFPTEIRGVAALVINVQHSSEDWRV